MNGLKLVLTAAIASISLVTAVALPSPDRATHPPAARVIPFGPSTSELMDDQLMLVSDTRKLRRELKRGAGSTQIAAHRDEIRRDWLNIVRDREFPAYVLVILRRNWRFGSRGRARLLPSQR